MQSAEKLLELSILCLRIWFELSLWEIQLYVETSVPEKSEGFALLEIHLENKNTYNFPSANEMP